MFWRSKAILKRPEWSKTRALFKSMGYSDDDLGRPLIGSPRQALERKPVADQRVTRHEIEALGPEEPGPGQPLDRLQPPPERQHVAHGTIETALEDAGDAGPLDLVLELGVEGIDVGGQAAFAP